MSDRITLSISNAKDIVLVHNTYYHVTEELPIHNKDNLDSAIEELIENVLMHAYDGENRIFLQVSFITDTCHIEIEVDDHGIPFDFSRYLSEPVDGSADHSKGFYLIYDLVDRFYFKPLSEGGKRFTIIQTFTDCFDLMTQQIVRSDIDKQQVLDRLEIRSFVKGDGDGIAKLIYRNYDYTYYKHLFYNPQEVRKVNESGDINSIVAVYDDEIIGHFALVRAQYSNIAEIAVATVDPRYKRMGIMNLMFDYIIDKAKKLGYQAIYGEAIMLHPYSQKANLSHGMTECAIVLGEVPEYMEIEKSVKNPRRSGVLVGYLLFDKHPRYIVPCRSYGSAIDMIYYAAGVPTTPEKPTYELRDAVTYRINRSLNIAFIRFEALISEHEFLQVLNDLLKEHCDMIYADINLHRIEEIDQLCDILNRHLFFYSGVLFALYDSEDYLRLQHKNSNHIDDEQLVYYSANAKAMMDYIIQDETRVNHLLK